MCSAGAIGINFELENQFPASQASKRRLNVNNENIRKRCETCSKLTINRLERPQYVVLVSLLLTLNIFHTFLSVSTPNR